ncbi:MAG: BON domain-containing protein [Verrucomicrobiales bacterium]
MGALELGTPPAVAERRRENQAGTQTQAETTTTEQADDSQPKADPDTDARTKLSDSEIKEAIEASFEEDPRLSDADLRIEVQDNTVTLSGEVSDRVARKTAEREASGIYRVSQVNNEIEIQGRESGDAGSLQERAEKALARNASLEDEEIDVAVENDTVTLEGTVDSTYAKNKAETVVSGLAGVQDVANELQVEGDSEGEITGFTYYSYYYYGFPDVFDWSDEDTLETTRGESRRTDDTPSARTTGMSDSELKEEIESEIFWSWFVDSDAVEVEVNNGEVILTGTVDDLGEKEAAAKNARDAGAQRIDNRLLIEG